MDSNITIRAYEAADTEDLLAIWFAASIEAHGFIGKTQLREQRVAIEQTYLPNAETWVACEMQKPLGFISLIDAFVGGLFVSPDHQGRGIGRMLIQHAAAGKAVCSWKSTLRMRAPTASTLHSASRSCLGGQRTTRDFHLRTRGWNCRPEGRAGRMPCRLPMSGQVQPPPTSARGCFESFGPAPLEACDLPAASSADARASLPQKDSQSRCRFGWDCLTGAMEDGAAGECQSALDQNSSMRHLHVA